MNWQQMVEERNVWVARNFPDPDGNRTPLDSVLGCIEEIGELTHHHLKQAQSIRGTDDFHEKEARDAIGDCSVYLMGVMSYFTIVPQMMRSVIPGNAGYPDEDKLVLQAARWAGRLADNEITWHDRRQAQICVDWMVATMITYCELRGWSYEQIVTDTWDHVKQRDWILYPETGLPPVMV